MNKKNTRRVFFVFHREAIEDSKDGADAEPAGEAASDLILFTKWKYSCGVGAAGIFE